MHRLARTIQALMRITLWLSALAIMLMSVFTFYDVLMRYLFHRPTIWVTEVSIYMLQFLVFIPAGMLVIEGSHLRVTVWIEALKGRTRRMAEIVTTLMILPYAVVLIRYGWSYTDRALQRGTLSPTLLQVPLWTVYMMIPIGGVLLVLGVLAKCALEAGRMNHDRAAA